MTLSGPGGGPPKKRDSGPRPGPGGRRECYVCRRPAASCLCAGVRPFSTKMRFVILMHDKEARRQRTGTARLAALCLKNSELLVGTDFTRDERVNALLRDPSFSPFVLFPGPEAADFRAPAGKLIPDGKTLLIFVVDGTWTCAGRMLNRSLNLRSLPRFSFSRPYVSGFSIKRQPRENCVSTIEAVYHLCQEAQEAGYEDLGGRHEVLLTLLKTLVDQQLSRGAKAASN